MADYLKRNGGFLRKALTAIGIAVFDNGHWDAGRNRFAQEPNPYHG
jgi:hypothetical protein